MKKLYTALVLTLFVLPLVAQNIPSYVPKNGLVGYWPFNGNANDESGNGNHGTVNGATLTTDRNGVGNSAYSFDGYSNFISVPNSSSIDITGKEISITLWLNQQNLNSDFLQKGISKSGWGIGSGYELLYRNTYNGDNGAIQLSWAHGGLQQTYDFNSKNSKWINITTVFSNGIGSFFVDGKLISTNKGVGQAFTNFISNNYPLLFGKRTSGQQYCGYVKGIMDDIAIYNRALTEQEVKQLYAGCTKEKATSSSFNSVVYTTNTDINLYASPSGGAFSGEAVTNNAFNPSKAKLGKNQIKYNFKNSTGCADSTDFTMLVVDTVGATCTKFDTITVKNNVYDTVTIKNNVFDTVKVTKYDTLTVTNNVTKYDTITITNNVTKYDTVIINKTKYDTVIVKTNVFDTVKVTKYDTLTVTNNVTKYDTVSILKIKFKLTTGIHANQLSSLSIYPNPTSDVLHIEVSDAKALEGYRYRILDALGKEVYNQLVTQSTTEIPLKTLGAAGIYQFEILDATKTSIQSNKIVLQ